MGNTWQPLKYMDITLPPVMVHAIEASIQARLGVLPGVGLGGVGGEGVEAEASARGLDVGELGVNLVWAVLGGVASDQAALPVQVAERRALGVCPAVNNGALGHGGRVGNGVANGSALGVDVNQLASGDDGTHGQADVAASEVGVVGVGAATLRLHALRAVVGRRLA